MHSSVLHQEMDYEPYYMEWIKQVSKERRALQLHLLWEKLQTVLKKIKNRIESFLRKYYPIIGGVIATVLVVVISCPYLCRPVTGLDEIYKDVIASKKFSTLEIVLESEVTPNVLSFSESSHPGSDAMQAFRAGLLKGQQDLLSRSTPVEKDWSKWAHYFKLGRWTVLLESVCHSIPQYEVPKGFWDDQKQIFAQLSNDFSIKPDMIDETEVDWVRSRFDGYIGPLLKQPHKASLLAEELKLMREGLMP